VSVPDSTLTELPEQDYAAIRTLVKTGDLAICSGTLPFSRLIQWATGSPWSHIAMIVRLDDLDRVMVIEAVAKDGVHLVPLSRFLSGGGDASHPKPFAGKVVIARHDDFAAKAADGGLRKLDEFAFDRLGTPFSATEIAKIGFRIFLGAFGVKIPRMATPDDEYFCSEYLAACFQKIGIDIPWDGRGFIAPDDFAHDPKVQPLARVAHRPFASDKGA
jgi:hypothetical protein